MVYVINAKIIIVDMPVCEIHTNYYTGEICPYCFNNQRNKSKQADKDALPILYANIQNDFNHKMKLKYKKGNIIYCSTCPEKILITKKGIWGMHWGHFYDKNIFWYFTFHILNGLPQCYNCNINLKGNKIILESELINIHGKVIWQEFTTEVETWYNEMKQGLHPSSITLDFLNQYKNKK